MSDELGEGVAKKQLLSRAKNGDMAAFEQLILEHEKIVYNVALRMMNHREDADDIAQEVFIKAFRSIGNFDERATFSTWIYRITVNTCIDEMRKRKGKQNFSLDSEIEDEEGSFKQQIADKGETPEESLLRQEGQSEIVEALRTLSEDHKMVVILRDVQGLSYDEVAEATGTSLGTVKSRLSRGRNQLKAEILKMRERNGNDARHKSRKEGSFREM